MARYCLGDIRDWQTFENERKTADEVVNRRAARRVTSQIGRNYRALSTATQKLEHNFARCEYNDLARLCDEIKSGSGLSTRLDKFEKTFFPLADRVKQQFPFYAHVSISTYGLRFEFPEHHFLRDIETALPELLDTLARLTPFMTPSADTKRDSDLVARLVAREKFLSVTFSLVEALNVSFGSLLWEKNTAVKSRLRRLSRWGNVIEMRFTILRHFRGRMSSRVDG